MRSSVPGLFEQAFLRKNTDLDVDRPAVFPDQRLHALEAAQAYAGVHLDLGAHQHRAVHQGLFQRALAARVDILGGEGRLGPCNLADGFLQVAALGTTALEDAGLVEMNVALDQSRGNQPPAGVEAPRVRTQLRHERDDAAVLDADVEQGGAGRIVDTGVREDEVHVARLPLTGSQHSQMQPDVRAMEVLAMLNRSWRSARTAP
jgi:hypothetical protein